jgi:hypothetical protein
VAWDGALSINENAFNIDASGNLWINGTTKETAKFSITNEGDLAIGPTAFNVDKDGNLWINGTKDNAVFSVSYEGIVKMTKGSITLGSGDNQFKVTDDGLLTLGKDAF